MNKIRKKEDYESARALRMTRHQIASDHQREQVEIDMVSSRHAIRRSRELLDRIDANDRAWRAKAAGVDATEAAPGVGLPNPAVTPRKPSQP